MSKSLSERPLTGRPASVMPGLPDARQPATVQRSLVSAATGSSWSPYSFAFRSEQLTAEDKRHLRTITMPMAFGESSGFESMAQRVHELEDTSFKLLLALQFADEARHAVGFACLLDQLLDIRSFESYPSQRYGVRFFGLMARTKTVDEWLFSILCTEFFARSVYRELSVCAPGESTREFFTSVLQDEHRHVAFLRAQTTAAAHRGALDGLLSSGRAEDLVGACRDMITGRNLPVVTDAAHHFGFDIGQTCDRAENQAYTLLGHLRAGSAPSLIAQEA